MKFGCLIVFALLSLSIISVTAQPSLPNFVVMFVDDLGYGDLGCFGNPNVSTPNLDRMAQEGIKFTQWISGDPLCTPSRAALLTGRLPVRSGMNANILRVLLSDMQPGGLPDYEITIAEALRQGGYATAISGKWHLGINNHSRTDGVHLPLNHGFDSYLGYPFTNNPLCKTGNESILCFLYSNHSLIQQPMRMENLTQELTTHSVEFIMEQAAQNRPFFLYNAWVHVHTAMFTNPAFTGRSRGGRYGDNIEEMDWSAGEILNTIRKLGIEQNTLVIFASDNGPYLEDRPDAGSTGGLKGGKGQTYEGGIRVPGIAWWPGVIPSGVVSDTLTGTMDIFPTFLNLAGIPIPKDREYDGKDITKVLLDPKSAPSPHEFMFHYCGLNITAVRHGRYKVHFKTQIWTSDTTPNSPCQQCCPYSNILPIGVCGCLGRNLQEHDPPLIYDMDTDPYEVHLLTPANFPDFYKEVQLVKEAVAKHYAGVIPVPNQLNTIPNPLLRPCCNWPSCSCNHPPPNRYANGITNIESYLSNEIQLQ